MNLLFFRTLAASAISTFLTVMQARLTRKINKTVLIILTSTAASFNLMAQAPSHNEIIASDDNKSFKIIVTTSLTHKQQIQLSYPAPARVDQILSDSIANIDKLTLVQDQIHPAYSNNIFWTGAALFERFPHPQKQHLISQLKQLASLLRREGESEQSQAALNLAELIENLKVGQRIFTNLDYDLVRIEPQKNPLVSNNLTLVLPPRPSTVLIAGAVNQPKFASWQERVSASSYLNHVFTLNNSDNSEVWVIQPDGHVERHPIAYWNQKHFDIAPGATIYVSFSSLPDEYRTINEDIVNLLRNRAP